VVSNPCTGTRLPKRQVHRVDPLTTEQIANLTAAVPAYLAAMVTLAVTLDTYSHLWPDSDDRTREAVDAVLGSPADSVRTRAGGVR